MKQETTLYVVTAEIEAPKESEFYKETQCYGAFMNAFVTGRDALDAGMQLKKALEEDDFKNIKIEEIIESENYRLDSKESSVDYKALKKEALKTKEVVYGEFFLYEE